MGRVEYGGESGRWNESHFTHELVRRPPQCRLPKFFRFRCLGAMARKQWGRGAASGVGACARHLDEGEPGLERERRGERRLARGGGALEEEGQHGRVVARAHLGEKVEEGWGALGVRGCAGDEAVTQARENALKDAFDR